MEFLARASLLVNLAQDSHLAIPSKIFEYMRFRAWILALAVPESATARLLRGTGAEIVAPDDVDGVAEVLEARYRAFARGERPLPIAADTHFSRREQATRLFEVLEASLLEEGRGLDPRGVRRAAGTR